MIKLEIKGRIPSKKNSRRQVIAGGRRINIPSKAYEVWHELASMQLMRTRYSFLSLPFKEINGIRLAFTMPDNRRADLTNKAESVMDLLVDNKFLEDDSWQVTGPVILEPLGVDKKNSGVVIYIKEKTDEEYTF